MVSNTHSWSFSTVGGVKRVNLESGQDLAHLADLDPKLWTALSCPVSDLEIDKDTLALVDADKDGQIRVPEVIAAVNWLVALLNSPNDILKQQEEFYISAINNNTEEGKKLKDSAKVILKNLGKNEGDALCVADTSNFTKIFEGTAFNGDGIITEDSTTNDALITIIHEIISVFGGKPDRGGKTGIDLEMLQRFYLECSNYCAWQNKAKNNNVIIHPLGNETAEAYALFNTVKDKIDDYFVRCKLADYDNTAIASLNLQTAKVDSISDKNLANCLNEISQYPLAKVNNLNALNLSTGLNPAWELPIASFKEKVCAPLLNNTETLTEKDWLIIKQRFADYSNWLAEKEGEMVEPLGLDRINTLINENRLAEIELLFTEEQKLENEANNIIKVDQLVRYNRDLFTLLKNFVTFYDFYQPGNKAIFQAGTLYLDQRSCDLCIKVKDLSKHALLASFSGIYLIYLDCTSKATNEKMTIVAGLTNGDIDNLIVGRNAMFYDRKGLDWDATIIKIIENPISIRQAFFSPYRKLYRFIEEQINKMASAEDEKMNAKLKKAMDELPEKEEEEDKEKSTKENAPFDIGKFVGIFAAIGLAVGAIGTVIASIISGFLKLTWWKMPIAFAALLIVISGPAMIIAFLKLRKRSLAPLLEANGWAINSSVKINIHFGKLLTHLAELPHGAKINFNDPFNQKKFPLWPFLAFMALMACLAAYLLNKMGIVHWH